MRHWIGFGLAIALALTMFFGGGWGLARMSALPAEGLTMTSNRGLAALGVLTLVGLLLGILMVAPTISPLAAGLPGLVLLGWTALLSVSSTLAVRLIPMSNEPSGAGFHGLLASGVAALLGFAMIFPLFVPSRWWGDRRDDEGEMKGRAARGGRAGDGDEGRAGGEGRAGDGDEGRGRPLRRPRRPPAPPGLLEP
jgi:hypothetical protein